MKSSLLFSYFLVGISLVYHVTSVEKTINYASLPDHELQSIARKQAREERSHESKMYDQQCKARRCVLPITRLIHEKAADKHEGLMIHARVAKEAANYHLEQHEKYRREKGQRPPTPPRRSGMNWPDRGSVWPNGGV